MKKKFIKLSVLNLVLNLLFLLVVGFIFPLLLYGKFPWTWATDVNILVSIFLSAEALPIGILNFLILFAYNFYSLRSVALSPWLKFSLGLFIAYLSTFLVLLMVGLFVTFASGGTWVSPFLMIPQMAFPFPQGFILVGP